MWNDFFISSFIIKSILSKIMCFSYKNDPKPLWKVKEKKEAN